MRLNPYAWIAVLVIVASLVMGIWLHGNQRGKRVQAREDAAQLSEATGHRDALRRALNANARTFRAIDATTQANLRRAAAERQKSLAAETAAILRREALKTEIARINQQAERERTTCSHVEAQICGTPLR